MRHSLPRAGTAKDSTKAGSKSRKPRPSGGSQSRPSGRHGIGFWTSAWSSLPIFLVAVLLRAFHVHQMDRYVHFQVPVLDAAYFDDWAVRIAGGDWIGKEIFFVDPLYAYFLGAIYKVFGHSLDAVRIIQVVVGGVSAVLIQWLGVRLLGGQAGFACGLVAACYRPFIFYDGLLLKAVLKVPLTTLFLLFAVGVLEKSKNRLSGFFSGVSLGLAALVRGNLIAMVPFTVLAFMFLGKVKPFARAAAIVLFLAGAALVIAPVAYRNHKVGGELVLTASAVGQNMYIGNHPDNPSGSYVGPPFTRPNPDYEEIDFRAEAERRTGRKMTAGETSRFWIKETLEVMADNPWRTVAHLGKKVWLLTHAVEIPDNYSFDFETRFSWVLRLPFPAFAIIFPLGLIGAIAAWRDRKRPGLFFLVLFLLVYSLSLLPFFVISRYKVPMIPALIVLAISGAITLWKAWFGGEFRRALLYTLLAVGVGVYTRQSPGWIPNWEIHFNFGTEFREKGLLEEAEAQFREAVRLNPDFAEAYNSLGAVVSLQGRADEAARHFERARQLKPGYWEADYNQADLLYRSERYQEAGRLLERMLVEKPDSYEANLLLGLVRRRTGRTDEALSLYRKARAMRPDAVEAPYNEAMLLRDLGRIEEARVVLRELNQKHPEHEAARNALRALGG